MQVKKFEAPTIQEALDNIKRELGPEAIILQTKKNRNGFGLLSKGSVEVTAAVSDRAIQKKKYVETRLPNENRQQLSKQPALKQAEFIDKYTEKHIERAQQMRDHVTISRSAPTVSPDEPVRGKVTTRRYIDIDENATNLERRDIVIPPEGIAKLSNGLGAVAGKLGSTEGMTMEEELRQLKRMIQEMKTAKDDTPAASGAQVLMNNSALGSPALQEAFEQLVVSGMDKRFALNLLRKVAFELGADKSKDNDAVADQLANELMQSTEVVSVLNGIESRNGQSGNPAVVAIVGPTGVGKTTTVAKIASDALLKRNLKVGLVNLDSYKIAAFDQLGTYAKILNVPFRSVGTREELQAALDDFKNLDLVLVDTTGRSQRDPAALKEMHDVLGIVPTLRTHLVLSVTTRDTELYDMASRFSVFRPSGLVLSKLDEANLYGAIYNVAQKAKLPLAYFTTGQRVPEDIEEATRERVVALIMNI